MEDSVNIGLDVRNHTGANISERMALDLSDFNAGAGPASVGFRRGLVLGDVVRLRSGGKAMTVSDFADDGLVRTSFDVPTGTSGDVFWPHELCRVHWWDYITGAAR